MKFKVKVKGLLKAIGPIIIASTNSVDKDCKSGFNIKIKAQKNNFILSSYNGRLKAMNDISNITYDDLEYKNESIGHVVVKANEFSSAIQSFDINSEIYFEKVTENNGESLVITHISLDEEPDTQTLALVEDNVKQVLSKNMIDENKIIVRRDVWVEGANRIAYAHGSADAVEKYKYWIMRLGKDHIRFAAGDGPRFAVIDFNGKNITDANDSSDDIIFPNEQTKIIIDVFKNINNDKIEFYFCETAIFVKSGSIVLEVININVSIVWPNEEKFLNRKNVVRFTTLLGSWSNAVLGLMATYSDEMKSNGTIHASTLKIDKDNKVIKATSSTSQGRSNRKINIEDIDEKIDNLPDNVEFPQRIRCVTSYLEEIIKNGKDDDMVQFEIVGENNPIVVRYYANNNVIESDKCINKNEFFDIEERFSIFFSPYVEK